LKIAKISRKCEEIRVFPRKSAFPSLGFGNFGFGREKRKGREKGSGEGRNGREMVGFGQFLRFEWRETVLEGFKMERRE
jgi:hypothetical protein